LIKLQEKRFVTNNGATSGLVRNKFPPELRVTRILQF
jgi:hypothetical protein